MSRYLLVPVDGGSNKSVILPKDIFMKLWYMLYLRWTRSMW